MVPGIMRWRTSRRLKRCLSGARRKFGQDGRRLLGVPPGEPVRYRHVRLVCGDKLLSEADNWYVPARLTPEMNRLLDETDTPFGRVIRDLNFRRETLSARVLWQPLPGRWEMQALPEFDPQSGWRRRARSWSTGRYCVKPTARPWRWSPKPTQAAPSTFRFRSRPSPDDSLEQVEPVLEIVALDRKALVAENQRLLAPSLKRGHSSSPPPLGSPVLAKLVQ